MDVILLSHFIDPVSLRNNDYAGFIEARRARLVEQISEKMGKAVSLSGEAVAEDESDEDVA